MTNVKTNVLLALGSLAITCSMATAQDARQILDASDVQGGLVVVVGCDDPTLLAELRASESYLVHGLDRDPERVAVSRNLLREKGLYGPVTVSQWNGAQLPFVDSVVNLVVARSGYQVSDGEIRRVLAPGGALIACRSPASHLQTYKKPWPADLDEWSHYLYDASNNAVSRDTTVGPPSGLRWTCGPEFARSHEHFASMSAMVSAGGRIFYIIDEGPVSSVYLPSRWKLVARDAFSGVLLWKRSIANWEARLRGFRSGPPEIGRRLVADDERLFVSLGYGEPVTVLDAATGNRLATLAGTGGARELLLEDDVLYVLADDMTTAQHNERRDRINREFLQTSPELVIWQRLSRGAFPMYGTQQVVATETGSGKLLWKSEFKAPGEIMPTTMAVNDGGVCLQTVSHVVCLNAVEGKELWRRKRAVARSRYSWSTPTLVIHDGVVLSLDRAENDSADDSPPSQGSKWLMNSGMKELHQDAQLVALSLDDSKELWRAAYSENYNTPGDVFVIDGVVWIGNLRRGVDPGFTQGRDLHTGKITTTIPPQKAWGHHRCYRNKATVNWLMVGRGGIQFIDPGDGTVRGNSWVRGTCQYGVMPANGLVYAPQHSCACQPEELLTGLNALSPQSSAGEGPPPLEKGPAYRATLGVDAHAPARSLQRGHDWPTYRGDVRRSGYQDLNPPVKPGVVWTARLTSPITAPVVADGLVFVVETDRHTLHALSAAEGESVWTFIADGRIDSPPTVAGGRCLFGTRSGFVYCLRASDGALVWRFRAAPQDRRLFAYEQLESAWPVHGSVLVDDRLTPGVQTAYFAAGRSARIDGGIRLYALRVQTGELLHQADVSVPGGRGANVIRQSVLPDILSIQQNAVWMRGLGVDKNLVPVEDVPHLFAPRGLLDDTWWHRTYWLYGTAVGGGYSHWPAAGNAVPAGRLLVFDGGESIYGYGRMTYRLGDGHVRPQATNDYKLFAEVLTPKPRIREDARGETRQVAQRREIRWATHLPFVAQSIVLTPDALLVAGGTSLPDAAQRDSPGILRIASRQDGAKREDCPLPAAPVLDGMALTDSGVFVSMTNGSVACLRSSEKTAERSKAEKPSLHERKQPNVLFIAVDDLNDWVGCLGGHPQAKTPNIDRLAQQGVLFERAYCAAPLCNPSRTSTMTGLRPSTTGIYGNLGWFRDIPKYEAWETIPQSFRKHGYIAWAGGKIYHQSHGKFSDPIAWDRQYSTQMGTPPPPEANRYRHGMRELFSNKILARLVDWEPIEQPAEQTDDWQTAEKAAQFLRQEHDKPFFLACGIYHPHLPWYVPQKYFDMYPLESVELPVRKDDDLDDVPPVGLRMVGEAFQIIKRQGRWREAVQGRLASGSFADACVGRVLGALEKSEHRDNTIVVLWGDHGYDIGEKKFAKSALWEQTSRTPLIICAPGVSKSGGRCRRPVSLVDLYPTLIELCGLPVRNDLDGRSLAPLVRNPEAAWPYPAIITHSPWWHGPNHAIRSQRYHYIRYSDGGEELYDMSNDPHQWKNLAGAPENSKIKDDLVKWLPKVNAKHFRPETLKNR